MIKNEKTRDWVNRIVSLVIAGGAYVPHNELRCD